MIILFATGSANAQWNANTAQNNPVAQTSAADQLYARVEDGNGGVIYCFAQNADNVYAQKISREGVLQWAPANDPIVVCNAAGYQTGAAAASDGSGGIFIAWTDERHGSNPEIYIQHLDAGGNATWTSNGTRVTNTSNTYNHDPALCSDGAGGVIVVWNWNNNSSNIQVSAQRYNPAGVAQWTANGVQVCTAPGFRGGKAIVSDANNGAIICFVDTRNDVNGTNYSYVMSNTLANLDVYAQRISSAGTLLWTGNGSPVCNAAGNQQVDGKINIIAAGAGGAIIAFDDYRNDSPGANGVPTNVDVYAQRLNNLGQVQWLVNGVPVNGGNGNQFLQQMVTDGQAGAVFCFSNLANDQLKMQRLSATGSALWAPAGVAITPTGQLAASPSLIPDGLGNYIVAYEATALQELRAQKINNDGLLQWNTSGITISNPPLQQPTALLVAPSGLGNAIISWQDRRNGLAYQEDIFASKLLSAGTISGPVPEFISVADGNWNVGSTWVGGVVPTANAAVTIRHSVALTTNVECFSVAMEAPAGFLNIQPGKQLTLHN